MKKEKQCIIPTICPNFGTRIPQFAPISCQKKRVQAVRCPEYGSGTPHNLYDDIGVRMGAGVLAPTTSINAACGGRDRVIVWTAYPQLKWHTWFGGLPYRALSSMAVNHFHEFADLLCRRSAISFAVLFEDTRGPESLPYRALQQHGFTTLPLLVVRSFRSFWRWLGSGCSTQYARHAHRLLRSRTSTR